MSSPEANTPAPTPKPASSTEAKPPRTMEQNLMVAIALAAVVLLATQYFFPQPVTPTKEANAVATEKAATEPVAGTASATTAEAPAAPATPIAAQSEQTEVIETDLYKVTFTNRGAVVKSWLLKRYNDSNDKPLDLVNTKAAGLVNLPFSLAGLDSKPLPAVNDALYTATRTPDGLGVDFEFSDGANYAKKSFRFQQGRYLVDVATAVRQGNAPKPHLLAWRGGFGDYTVIGAAGKQMAVFYDSNQQKLLTKSASDASEAPQVNRGAYSFAGVNDQYFAAVALPEQSSDFRITAVSANLPNHVDNKEELHVGVLIGGEAENAFPMFIGPKDTELMREISPKLDTLVDWGWWGFLAKPLFAVLHWVNDGFVHNWGWSIVVVTILINIATLPFRFSGLKASRKMAAVQPEIKKLQEKYAGMSMRDPRRAKQNEEMMAIYSRHGVSPLSGCVPNLLILPVALAFYAALTTVIELRGADWLWVKDLSRPETLAIHILPILMLVTQLLTMKLMPQPGGDPSQQKMMMLMMPVMLLIFMYQAASGLVLYWLTSNVVGIGQQVIFNRFAPAPAAPPAVSKAPAKKK